MDMLADTRCDDMLKLMVIHWLIRLRISLSLSLPPLSLFDLQQWKVLILQICVDGAGRPFSVCGPACLSTVCWAGKGKNKPRRTDDYVLVHCFGLYWKFWVCESSARSMFSVHVFEAICSVWTVLWVYYCSSENDITYKIKILMERCNCAEWHLGEWRAHCIRQNIGCSYVEGDNYLSLLVSEPAKWSTGL